MIQGCALASSSSVSGPLTCEDGPLQGLAAVDTEHSVMEGRVPEERSSQVHRFKNLRTCRKNVSPECFFS